VQLPLLLLAVVVFSFPGFLQIYAESDSVTMHEWNVPTPDSAPHDVVVGTYGMI